MFRGAPRARMFCPSPTRAQFFVSGHCGLRDHRAISSPSSSTCVDVTFTDPHRRARRRGRLHRAARRRMRSASTPPLGASGPATAGARSPRHRGVGAVVAEGCAALLALLGARPPTGCAARRSDRTRRHSASLAVGSGSRTATCPQQPTDRLVIAFDSVSAALPACPPDAPAEHEGGDLLPKTWAPPSPPSSPPSDRRRRDRRRAALRDRSSKSIDDDVLPLDAFEARTCSTGTSSSCCSGLVAGRLEGLAAHRVGLVVGEPAPRSPCARTCSPRSREHRVDVASGFVSRARRLRRDVVHEGRAPCGVFDDRVVAQRGRRVHPRDAGRHLPVERQGGEQEGEGEGPRRCRPTSAPRSAAASASSRSSRWAPSPPPSGRRSAARSRSPAR